MAGPVLDLSQDHLAWDGLESVQLAKRATPGNTVPHTALLRPKATKEAVARLRGGSSGTGGYYVSAVQTWEIPTSGLLLDSVEVGDYLTDSGGLVHQLLEVERSDLIHRVRAAAVRLSVLLPDQITVESRSKRGTAEGDSEDVWVPTYTGPGKIHRSDAQEVDQDRRTGLRPTFQVYVPAEVEVAGQLRVRQGDGVYEVQWVEAPDEIARLQVLTADRVA